MRLSCTGGNVMKELEREIMQVLKEYGEVQTNIASESARKEIAKKILERIIPMVRDSVRSVLR